MSDSATHNIRFSDAVYGPSTGSYSDRCVCISIHISRVNSLGRNTIKQSLVLHKQAKLSKRPSRKFGSKGYVSSFRSKPNLRRKLKCGSERMINLGVQFDFIENLFLPCHFRNGTAHNIPYPRGLKEHYSLIIYGQKLDFQGQFHNEKLTKVAI